MNDAQGIVKYAITFCFIITIITIIAFSIITYHALTIQTEFSTESYELDGSDDSNVVYNSDGQVKIKDGE